MKDDDVHELVDYILPKIVTAILATAENEKEALSRYYSLLNILERNLRHPDGKPCSDLLKKLDLNK